MIDRDSLASDLGIRDIRDELRRVHENWGWLLALGVILTLLGLICVVAAGFTTLISVAFIGSLLCLCGIAQIVHAFSFRVGHGFLLNLLAGVLYGVFGVLMLTRPAVGAVSLTLLIASFLLAGGVLRAVLSGVIRYPNWGWGLFSGVVTAVLGFYIALNIVQSSIWLIGTVVGIEMLFNGWAWIMLASAAKAYQPDPARLGDIDTSRRAG